MWYKRNLLVAIGCYLVLVTGLTGAKTPLIQDFRIATDGTQYYVYGVVDGKRLFKSDQASEAIQYAIDQHATDGGQVIISKGDFPLDQPIRMADRIHLLGSGRASKLRVTESNSAGVGITAERMNAMTISNLSVTAGNNPNAKIGISIDDCGNSKILDVFCVGFSEYGISMRNNSFLNEIRGCHLAGNEKANLYFEQLAKGRFGDFLPNMVANCMIYGGGKGIALNRVIVMNISDCMIYQTKGPAFHIYNVSNSVLVSGCRTFQITGPAVLVEDSDEFNCSGNIFCWHTEQGILLRNVNWGTITGNEIIDTGSYNSGKKDQTTQMDDLPENLTLYDGIEMQDAHGYHVGGNTIFNWKVCPKINNGISEDSQSSTNIIANNNVNYFAGSDVVSNGKGTTVQGNVSLKDEAHQPMEGRDLWIQSFRTELIDGFIDMQKKVSK